MGQQGLQVREIFSFFKKMSNIRARFYTMGMHIIDGEKFIFQWRKKILA